MVSLKKNKEKNKKNSIYNNICDISVMKEKLKYIDNFNSPHLKPKKIVDPATYTKNLTKCF